MKWKQKHISNMFASLPVRFLSFWTLSAERMQPRQRKAASEHIIKLLDRAVADAENNFHMNRESLYVSECFVTPGPTLKRMMPRGKGSADRILKRTSHITLAVKERD